MAHDARAAALAASACCVGPLLLLGLGVSGAWIRTLTALEPFRPYFTILTLALLGFGFYRIYSKPKAAECREGSYCANPRADTINKTVLWFVTVAILGLLAFPYAAPHLFAGLQGQAVQQGETSQVVLAVENMTCVSCPVTVAGSLRQVPGVVSAEATLNPPRGRVRFDSKVATLAALVKATTDAGYPSAPLREQTP